MYIDISLETQLKKKYTTKKKVKKKGFLDFLLNETTKPPSRKQDESEKCIL